MMTLRLFQKQQFFNKWLLVNSHQMNGRFCTTPAHWLDSMRSYPLVLTFFVFLQNKKRNLYKITWLKCPNKKPYERKFIFKYPFFKIIYFCKVSQDVIIKNFYRLQKRRLSSRVFLMSKILHQIFNICRLITLIPINR